MDRRKSLLLALAIIALAALGTATNFPKVNAAPTWTVSLDATSSGAVDVGVETAATNTTGFRVGAVINASGTLGACGTLCVSGVFGWQLSINYDPTILIPQGLPNPAATPGNAAGLYVDGSLNTVQFGAQTAAGNPNWQGLITANHAFGSSIVVNTTDPHHSQIQVFYTVLAPNPAVNIAARNLLANVGFEMLQKPTTPQVLTISDIKFDNSAGTQLPNNVIPGTSATITLPDAPPVAMLRAIHLPTGSTACGIATPCTAFAYNFTATGSFDSDGTIANPTGYFWDIGGAIQDYGVSGPNLIVDFGAAFVGNVTLRVQDNSGNTGASRDPLGAVLLGGQPFPDTQPSHNQFVNFNSADVPATAAFTFTQQSGRTLNFNAGSSVDPDGTITKYAWNFGDSTNSTGVTASHTFRADGNYTVQVAVTDNGGATSYAKQLVKVVAAALAPDFTIAPSAAVAVPVGVGKTGTETITVTALNGLTGTVALTASPSTGLTCSSLTSVVLPPSPGTSTLSCSATVTGDYTVAVMGSIVVSGTTISHATAVITYHVVDFTIAPSAPVTVNTSSGVAGTQTITVTALNGLAGTVALSASPSAGLTCSPLTSVTLPPSPGLSSLSCSATVTVTTSFTVTVTGSTAVGSTTISHTTATITYSVSPAASIAIAPSSPVTVGPLAPGASGTQTITVTAQNGFTGTVTLTASSSSGLTCSALTSVVLPGPGTSTLSCNSAVAGDYTVTVMGSATGVASKTTAVITYHVVDFTIAPSTPVTVNTSSGVAGTQTITLTAVNGLTGSIALSASPSTGLTCSPLTNAVLPTPGTSTLSCSATVSVPTDFTVTVSGSITVGGTVITHATATITYHVTVAAAIAIAPSSPVTVGPLAPGGTGTQTITVTAQNGFTGTVTLTASPSTGLTCSPLTSVVLPGPGTSTLSCNAAVAGDYTVTVMGSATGVASKTTAIITYHVVDFTIAPSAPVTVNTSTGVAGTQTITVTAQNGFAGTVALTASPLTGLTCSPLTSAVLPGPGTSTLSCSATVAGDYTVTVSGVSGAVGPHTTAVITYHVTVPSGFTIAPSSPVTVGPLAPGATGTQTITVTSVSGFTGTVALAASPSAGLVCSPLTSVVLPPSPGMSTLSCSATVAGDYTVTVTGTATGATPQTTAIITYHVVDFTIAPSAPVTVNTGSGVAGTQTITVTTVNGLTGTVALSASPSTGLTCLPLTSVTLPPSPGSSTLSCSATDTVTTSFTVAVTGSIVIGGTTISHTTATITYSVSPGAAITIAPSSPVTVGPLAPGASGTQTITVTAQNGFTGTVTLTASPSTGLICSPLTSVVLPGPGTSTLSCNAAVAGDYTVTVMGSATGVASRTTAVITYHVIDFTIAPSAPVTVSTGSGVAGTQTITVTAVNGLTGTIALSASPSTGLTCSPLTNAVLPTPGTSTLSCSATVSVPTDFTVTVSGSITVGGTVITHATATITYHISVAAAITIAPSSPVSVGPLAPGASGTQTITITGLNGFTGTVTLSASPSAGLTCSPLANVVIPPSPNTSTLSCNAAVAGDYTVTVTGGATGVTSQTTAVITYHVVDFTIAPSAPVTVNANSGVAGTQTISVAAVNGLAGTVGLSASPSTGLTCSPLTSVTLPPSPGTSTLSCIATVTVTTSFTVTVTGSIVIGGTTISHTTATITYTVAPGVVISIAIAPSSPVTVGPLAPGASGTQTITVTAQNGFTGTVTLTASPSLGLTCSALTSVVLPGPGTSTLSCNAAVAGDYTVTVMGSATGVASKTTAIITYHVVDFTIAPSAPITVTVGTGNTGTQTISANALNGLTGTIALSASPSTGLICSSLTSVVLPGPGTSTLSCSAAVAGDYTVTVTGSTAVSGTTISHSTAVMTYHVTAPDVPPTCSITSASPNPANTGQMLTLNFSCSDTDGTVTSISINWGDGSAATSVGGTITSATHIYTSTGNAMSMVFTITVTATDNAGLQGSTTTQVTVKDRPPTVSFTESATTANTGQPITLTITAADPDGTVAKILVYWGDGTIDTLSGTATSDSHSYTSPNTYSVFVNATDNSGLSTWTPVVTKTITQVTGATFSLTFQAFDADDFENGVGQLDVWLNGNLVVNIPGGQTGSGDFAPYMNTWINFGPFDVTNLMRQGTNNITFSDPLTSHEAQVRNIMITSGSQTILNFRGTRDVNSEDSLTILFSNPPVTISSFTAIPNPAVEGHTVTFTATYAGGVGPFRCRFNFGDGSDATVTSTTQSCSVTHTYQYDATFNATVNIRGANINDRAFSKLIVIVLEDSPLSATPSTKIQTRFIESGIESEDD